MSYQRRSYAPRTATTYKKRSYRRRPPMYKSANSMVVPGYTRTGGFYGRYNHASRTSRLANSSVELKFLDTALSGTVDATGEVPATGGQICLIPQGDTQSSRDGRKCVVKSVLFRGTFAFAPGANPTAAESVFLWLILDKQCNGAAAAVTDVFTSTSMNTCLHNLSNSERFSVVKKFKKSFNPGAGVSTAYDNVTVHIEFFKKCNVPLQFSSTTGALTEIRSNNLFWIWGCDALSDTVTCTGNTRIRFVG